jgi:glycosyltransferase involved in cell wall biosynthesis
MGELRDRGFDAPIAVIANPFDLPEEPVEPVPRTYDLIAVGNYAEAKDYPWMMEVLAAVRERIPGVSLAVVGKGPFQQKLEDRITRYGLADSLRFLGWQDQAGLDRAYRSSSILLLTSRTEGLPMVVLEAMSHGLPVVVTDVGEIPWLMTGGSAGRMVPHGDTRAMADAVVELLDDPEARAREGSNGRARVRELLDDFSGETIAVQWRRLIAEVLRRDSDGGAFAPGPGKAGSASSEPGG